MRILTVDLDGLSIGSGKHLRITIELQFGAPTVQIKSSQRKGFTPGKRIARATLCFVDYSGRM
jgi:hypothetical protein